VGAAAAIALAETGMTAVSMLAVRGCCLFGPAVSAAARKGTRGQNTVKGIVGSASLRSLVREARQSLGCSCLAERDRPRPTVRTTTSTMKLELKPFDFNQAVARAGLRPDGTPLAEEGAGGRSRRGGQRQLCARAMAEALQNVSRDQMDAQRLQKEFSLDNPTVSLEQTMVAMQKSQIGFQAAVRCATGCCRAYTDIMNMQV
jgi:flagellar hook-basal body complex protein FliE